ncbi:MAG: hypothetical protein ACTSX6_00315 [Candidatus Heimdallarchaeaceae archaeon]
MMYGKLEGLAREGFDSLLAQMKAECRRINPGKDFDRYDPATGKVIEGELEIRALLPEDLGLSAYTYSFAVTGALDTIVNKTIEASRVIGIYGFTDTTSAPKVDQINVDVGTKTVRQWPVAYMVGNTETKSVFFADPVMASETKTIKIKTHSSAATTENLTIHGLIAKPKD